MINYLQNITEHNARLRSPKSMEVFSCDERFIKYTRKVVYT